MTCPDNILTNTSKGKPTSNIVWSVQVSDNSVEVDPNAVIQVRASHESGQELPLGRTVIKVTATDKAGNMATCESQVEVKGKVGSNLIYSECIVFFKAVWIVDLAPLLYHYNLDFYNVPILGCFIHLTLIENSL